MLLKDVLLAGQQAGMLWELLRELYDLRVKDKEHRGVLLLMTQLAFRQQEVSLNVLIQAGLYWQAPRRATLPSLL